MARDLTDSTPLASRDDLVAWFEEGGKPRSAFRIGTEHEKIPFYRHDLAPVPYEACRGGSGGIRALLEGVGDRLGWQRIDEGGQADRPCRPDGGGAISLEPGGQFELSGAPLATLHETGAETRRASRRGRRGRRALGIGFLGLGMQPAMGRSPKRR